MLLQLDGSLKHCEKITLRRERPMIEEQRMIDEQRAREAANLELVRKLALATGLATPFIFLLARLFLFWLRSSPT